MASDTYKHLPLRIRNIASDALASDKPQVLTHFYKEASFWELTHGHRAGGAHLLALGNSVQEATGTHDINAWMLKRDATWLANRFPGRFPELNAA